MFVDLALMPESNQEQLELAGVELVDETTVSDLQATGILTRPAIIRDAKKIGTNLVDSLPHTLPPRDRKIEEPLTESS